jgi:hypothetical protein
MANFPLNNAYQYHQQPPLPADLAIVVYGDLKNREALVVADASWYLVPKVPATSNKCYIHKSTNSLLNILMTVLHTCTVSVVNVPCCTGSFSEQLRFDVEL